MQIRNLVRYHLQTPSVTHGWWQKFSQRHREISRRRVQAFERLRYNALNEENLQKFFETLQLAYHKCRELSSGVELTPNRIFNMDEIGFDLNQVQGYIIAQRGVRSVPLLTSGNRTHVTVIASISAISVSLEPTFIVPGKRERPKFFSTVFQEAKQIPTSSGWITEKALKQWCEHFVEQIKHLRGNPDHWCLQIMDGHSTHTSIPIALSFLNENRILAVRLV
jgi:hypothetical protein